jgi:hypothetical protein
MLRGQSRGAAPGVARAVGSAPLPADREVPLIELWAMSPEAQQVPLPDFAGKPLIVPVSREHEHAWYDAANIPDRPPVTHIKLHGPHEASLSDYLTWYPGLREPRPPDKVKNQPRVHQDDLDGESKRLR